MLNIKKLKRPNKRSGHKLKPGARTFVRGIIIVNQNEFPVWVDRYTRRVRK